MTAGPAGRDHPIPVPPQPTPLSKAAPAPVDAGQEGRQAPAGAAGVLADRMAAALVHREPGWRLPRRSALARRYNVSLTEIDTAIADLARRSLVRRLPDGQLYRASPADYWIPVEGAGGLGTRLDPMGTTITCQSRHVSRREAPQDVAWALGLAAGAPIRVVRSVWSADGEPAAVSTAYLHETADDENGEAGRGRAAGRPRVLVVRRGPGQRAARRRGERRAEPAAARGGAEPAAVTRAAGDHGDGQVRRPGHRQPGGADRGHAQARVVQSCD